MNDLSLYYKVLDCYPSTQYECTVSYHGLALLTHDQSQPSADEGKNSKYREFRWNFVFFLSTCTFPGRFVMTNLSSSAGIHPAKIKHVKVSLMCSVLSCHFYFTLSDWFLPFLSFLLVLTYNSLVLTALIFIMNA